MRIFGLVVAALLLGVLAYVRLAPHDVNRWHQPVSAEADDDLSGGAVRRMEVPLSALALVDQRMRDVPRTTVLAGSVEARRVTYVTRSRWIGFPDYTTIEWSDGTLKAFARLRFGLSDLGVNRKRLERVLSGVQP